MTSNTCRRAIGAMLVAGALILPLQAQEEERSRERFGEGGQFREGASGEIVSFEPQMFAADSGSVRVDILFRVRYDFFVFTQEMANGLPSYKAHGELQIELFDSTDVSASRKVQEIGLHAQSNETSQLRKQYYQGAASFVVHPGRFTAVYRVEDGESKREFGGRKQILRVAPFHNDAFVRSTPVFVDPANTPASEHHFTALNNNGTARFSENTGVFITVADSDIALAVRYSLAQFVSEEKERNIVQKETTVTATVFRHSLLQLNPAVGENVQYVLDSNAATSVVYFPLATSHLRQGRYSADIHVPAGDTAVVHKEFSIRWIDMPLSLYDLDFAVAAMKYITTDQEYDELRSGNRENRIKKFEEFWAKRDKTPGTAYNEMMAEYFRRVDYTFTAFRTLKEDNGVFTDRGRIYILYGKPTTIERSLAPGSAPKEVWTYTSLNKQFTFEDPSRQGNYKLIASENK